MKLLILGATGPTGQQLVIQAVDSGHSVVALVRNAEKLKSLNLTGDKEIEIIEGSIFDAADMRKALTGCDAILSGLGGAPGVFTPCDVYSRSCDVAMEVMKELKVERFITCTAMGTKDDPSLNFLWRWVLKPTIMRNVVADMILMEDKLVSLPQDSGINWTVVKPPRLTKGPLTGVAPIAEEGQVCTKWPKNFISRADLAWFMLDCLTNSTWDRKLVAVTTGLDPAQQ